MEQEHANYIDVLFYVVQPLMITPIRQRAEVLHGGNLNSVIKEINGHFAQQTEAFTLFYDNFIVLARVN